MSMNAALDRAAAPVTFRERLLHIDIIRGIALLGVLVMNLHFWFRVPIDRYRLSPHPWGEFWNVGTDWFLGTFVEGKAMTTFAMLFAVGLAIQMERAESRDIPYWKFGFRRLGVLLVFGLLHIFLIWNGDILHNYALAGFLCLVFLRRKLKTILIWTGALWGLAFVVLMIFCLKFMFGTPPSPRTPARLAEIQASLQTVLQVRGHGTWLAEFHYRLREWVRVFGFQGELMVFLDILLKFLTGLAIWKSGILRDPAAHLSRLRRFFAWAFPLGLFLCLTSTVFTDLNDWTLTHFAQFRFVLPIVGIAQVYGTPIMALALGAGVLLLLQKASWGALLHPFSYMGRMALSNYLMQSLVMTFLFFGWGLGLYNRLGPLAGLCVSLGFFTLQVFLSRWWLARFQFGPMEWVWRSATYGKLQPMRIQRPLVLAPEPVCEPS